MRIFLRSSLNCKLLVGLTILAFLFSAGTVYAIKDLDDILKEMIKKCNKTYVDKCQKCVDKNKGKKALKCIDKAQKKLDACLDDEKIKKKAKAKTKDMNKKIDSFAKAFDKCQVENDKCVDKCNEKQKCIEKCNKTQLKCANKAAKKYGG